MSVMSSATLRQINQNIIELGKEVAELKEYLREDFELADDLKKELEEARNTPRSKLIKHEDVVKRFLK